MSLSLTKRVARRGGIRKGREVVSDYYPLKGGLNLVDSELEIPPGELADVKNYEPIYTSGYASVKGFERYDGNIAPSEAEYVYCTLNKADEDGQLISTGARDPTHVDWTDIGSPTKATVTGYDDVANAGFSLEDNDGAAHEGIYRELTVTAEKSVHLVQMFIEKVSGGTPTDYPHVVVGDPGSLDKRVHFGFDTREGVTYPAIEGGSTYAFKDMGQAYHVIEYNDDFWLCTFPWVNDGTSTTMRITIYPAFDSTANHGATGTTSTTGTLNFDLVNVYERATGPYFDPGDVNHHQRVPEQRLLDGEGWTYSGGNEPIISRAAGYDGENLASKLEDVSSTGNAFARVLKNGNTEVDGDEMWQFTFLVNKTSGAQSHYPAVGCVMQNGTGGNTVAVHVDTTNGTITDQATFGYEPILPAGIESYNDDFWLVWICHFEAGTLGPGAYVWPAAATVLGTVDNAAVGETTFDLISAYPVPLLPNVPPQTKYYPSADEPVMSMNMTDMLIDVQAREGRDFSLSGWTASNVTPSTTNVSPFKFQSNTPRASVINTLADASGAAAGYLEKTVSGFSTPEDDVEFMLTLWIERQEAAVQDLIGLYIGDATYGAEVIFDPYKGEFINISDSTRAPLEVGVYNWNGKRQQGTVQPYYLVWVKFTGNGSTSINLRLYPSYASDYSADAGLSDVASQATYDMVWPMLSWHQDKPHVAVTSTMDTSGTRGILTATNKIGSWQKGEIVYASGYPIGQLNTDPLETAPTAALDAAATLAAQTYAREKIKPVPGSGRMRGVAQLDGSVYAFRDDVNGDGVDVYKATSGWKKIDLNDKLRFDAGTSEITATTAYPLVGGTSGAEAYVKRVVVTSGSWEGGDAAGYVLIGHLKDGTSFSDGEQLTQNAVNVADANGAEEAQTFPAGGRYEFRTYNFFGHESTERIYGVNGVGKAFDLDPDDDSICQIETGMTSDTPTHIGYFAGSLFLSFTGGSVQFSGTASPLEFTVVTGASEMAIGEEVSAFVEETGRGLLVLGRNQTYIIYENDGVLSPPQLINRESGCVPYMAQRLSQTMYLDDRGVTALPAVERYGNFVTNSVSRKIQPLVDSKRGLEVSSHVSRKRNLFRLSYSDGTNIVLGFDGRKVVGATKTDYGIPLRVVHSYEDANGVERIFAGADDGFIYELDKGTSFDGSAIDAYLYPVFYNSKRPKHDKRYRDMAIDIVSDADTTLTFDYELNNGRTTVNQPTQTIAIAGTQQSLKGYTVRLAGEGRNIQPKFDYSQSDEDGHELHGVAVRYHVRQIDRVTRRS